MTKPHQIMINNHIRKLWLSIEMARVACVCAETLNMLVSGIYLTKDILI